VPTAEIEKVEEMTDQESLDDSGQSNADVSYLDANIKKNDSKLSSDGQNKKKL